MSYIINRYKSRFGKELKPLGFKLYKKTFYRVVNDILQIVILVKTPSSCTVEFDLVSLALGISDLYWEAGYSVAHFRKDALARDWWFEPSLEFFNNDTNSFSKIAYDDKQMDEIVEDMLTIMISEVIPVLERGVDAKTAYAELIQIEKMVRRGVHIDLRPDYGLAMLCIQSGDYDIAQQHLIGILERWDKAYPNQIAKHEEWGIDKPDLLFDRFLDDYKELKNLYDRLSKLDTEYLQNFILIKKMKSLEYLRDPRTRKKDK